MKSRKAVPGCGSTVSVSLTSDLHRSYVFLGQRCPRPDAPAARFKSVVQAERKIAAHRRAGATSPGVAPIRATRSVVRGPQPGLRHTLRSISDDSRRKTGQGGSHRLSASIHRRKRAPAGHRCSRRTPSRREQPRRRRRPIRIGLSGCRGSADPHPATTRAARLEGDPPQPTRPWKPRPGMARE